MVINQGEKYSAQLKEIARKTRRPLSVTFELTPLCNFNCSMCYIHLSVEEQQKRHVLKSADEWISLARECKEAGVLYVTLTGGEVFTHPDFNYIYKTLYDMGLLVGLLSNGYLLDDEKMNLFEKRKPNFIRITLYGDSDETYYKVCGVKNACQRVRDNVLRLKNAGINVSVSMTRIKDNEPDYEKIREWADKNNLMLVSTKNILTQKRGINNRAAEVRLDVSDEPDIEDGDSGLKGGNQLFIQNPFSHCNFRWSSMIITWDGKMIGCNSLVKIYQENFEGDVLGNFRKLWGRLDQLQLPEKCHTCKLLSFCTPCPGRIAGESGDPDIVAPYTCALAKAEYIRRVQGRQNSSQCDCDE